MKTWIVTAALGLAALAVSPRAEAWAKMRFEIPGGQQPGRHIALKCAANYAAPCISGMDRNYTQEWNPLDGNRWSNYRLVMGGQTVWFDMYDLRQGCSVGWGWQRGWSWRLYATGPDMRVQGPFEVCTRHVNFWGFEFLHLKASWQAWRGKYQIDFRRTGSPWPHPAVIFDFDPGTKALVPTIIRDDKGLLLP